jgi:hypothetical protein
MSSSANRSNAHEASLEGELLAQVMGEIQFSQMVKPFI